MNIVSQHRKTITAIVGAGIAFATLVVTSPGAAISSSEWLSGVIGLATACGVFLAPNKTA